MHDNKIKTVRSEMIKVMSITSLLIILVMGSVLTVIFLRQIYSNTKKDLAFYMDSTNENFDSHLKFLEESVLYIKNSEVLIPFFKGAGEITDDTVLDRNISLYDDANMVDNVSPVIKDLYIFNNEKESIGTHFYPTGIGEENSTVKILKDGINAFEKSKNTFDYIKHGEDLEVYIKLYDDDLKLQGFCVPVMDVSSINRIFSRMNKYEDYLWEIEANGSKKIFGNTPEVIEKKDMKYNFGSVTIKNTDYFYSMNTDSFAMCTYILVPENKMFMSLIPGLLLALGISLSVFLGAVLVIMGYTRKMSVELNRIIEKFEKVGEGDFNVKIEPGNIKELKDIGDGFNEMTDKINHLINEVYMAQIMVKEAQIQYLQAQINPHFIFNILSNIAIRLKIDNNESLYQMVNALSGMLQGKLFRKDEIEIRLEEEIRIIGFFLYLSQERFKGTVEYDIQCQDEQLLKCYIPKLCVEPFVENAMFHGLEPKGEKGMITLNIHQENRDRLVIVVEDDGVGFDKKILDKEDEHTHPRVGIMNISRLIQNLYGEDYGIEIVSKINEGTKVTIVLPIHYEKRM